MAAVIIPGNSEHDRPRNTDQDVFDRTAAATPPTIGGTPEQPAQQKALPAGTVLPGEMSPDTFRTYLKNTTDSILFLMEAAGITVPEFCSWSEAELELIGEPGAGMVNKYPAELAAHSDFLETWKLEITFLLAVGAIGRGKWQEFKKWRDAQQRNAVDLSPRPMPSRGPGMVGSSGASATPSGTATSSTAANPAPANLD